MSRPEVAYKVMPRADWTRARAEGRFEGSAIDLADGYIHMSTQAQLAETLARHYRGQADLVVLTVDLAAVEADLVWEPSRGGDLFPHLYAALPVSAVTGERAVAVAADGTVIGGEG
jgi:uncharacterized protein (DUF952 family)